MLEENDNLNTTPLAPDDLVLLRKFLEAWCDEHAVDLTDEAAKDTASALISWYQSDAGRRILLKPESLKNPPAPPRIQLLLQKLKQTPRSR
jgi:hypothetical protein